MTQEREYPVVDEWEPLGLRKGQMVTVDGELGLFKVVSIGLTMNKQYARVVRVFGGEGYADKTLTAKSTCYASMRAFEPNRVLPEGRSIKGGRQAGLVQVFVDELNATGMCSRPVPENKQDLESLRGRFYTAGRKYGVPVSVKVKDGFITARARPPKLKEANDDK